MKTLPLIALGVVLASCSKETPNAPNILARVGDEVLTIEQFQQAAKERAISGNDSSRRALFDELVNDMRAVHLAKQRGYDRDPDLLRQQRSLLIAKVREADGLHTESAPPTEQAIQDYYNQHQSEFRIPARAHAAMIKVNVQPNASAEHRQQKRTKIETALREARDSKATFAQLVTRYSEDQATRYTGGDLGWHIQTKEASEDPLLQSIFALDVSKPLSDIIDTNEGWMIVKLLDHQPATTRPFKQARGEILTLFNKQQAQDHERAYASKLESITAEVHPDRLPKITSSQAALAAQQQTPPLPR